MAYGTGRNGRPLTTRPGDWAAAVGDKTALLGTFEVGLPPEMAPLARAQGKSQPDGGSHGQHTCGACPNGVLSGGEGAVDVGGCVANQWMMERGATDAGSVVRARGGASAHEPMLGSFEEAGS